MIITPTEARRKVIYKQTTLPVSDFLKIDALLSDAVPEVRGTETYPELHYRIEQESSELGCVTAQGEWPRAAKELFAEVIASSESNARHWKIKSAQTFVAFDCNRCVHKIVLVANVPLPTIAAHDPFSSAPLACRRNGLLKRLWGVIF